MPAIVETLQELVAGAIKLWSSPSYLAKFALVGAIVLLWLVEARRRTPAPTWKAAGATSAWAVFYLGGFYAVFIGSPMYALFSRAVHGYAPFLEMNLLRSVSPLMQVIVMSVVMDFVAYWAHRWAHSNAFLWRFHRIHHSETQLMPLTTFRFHFGDLILRGLPQLIPAAILGATTTTFTIALFLELTLGVMAHADLNWTYGPFGRLLVSPAFHRVHHAVDGRLCGSNFATNYSLWDHLFGTAVANAERPASYGIAEPSAKSFLGQWFEPFLPTSVRERRRKILADNSSTPVET